MRASDALPAFDEGTGAGENVAGVPLDMPTVSETRWVALRTILIVAAIVYVCALVNAHAQEWAVAYVRGGR